MLNFKERESFKLITLLEEFNIKRKYINIFKILIQFFTFNHSTKKKIKKDISNAEKLYLFIDLYKERFYLENVIVGNNETKFTDSKINYNIINNIIFSEILYDRTIRFYIEYTLGTNEYSIQIAVGDKAFNVDEKKLNNEKIYDTFNSALYLLCEDIKLILSRLIYNSLRKGEF